MKIAYITDTEIPSKAANAVQTFRMCEAFIDAGYDLTLFCSGREAEISKNELFLYYGVKQGFNVKFVSPTSGSLKAYRFVCKLVQIVKQFNPDLVYTRNLYAAFGFLMLGRRVMFELHKCPSIDGAVSRYIFQKLVKQSALCKLIVISNALKQDIQASFQVPTEKIQVAHDGASISCEQDCSIALPKDRLNIGYLGSSYAGKGVFGVIELAKKCPKYYFHIIGCELNDVINRFGNGIPSNICFYGYVAPAVAKNYLQDMDVLIAPFKRLVLDISGRNIAGWMSPLKIFEYMAARKPIVTSNLDVIKEVLVDNETALSCEPENIAQFAEAIDRLASDIALRNRLGSNAFNELEKRYTWKQRVLNIMK